MGKYKINYKIPYSLFIQVPTLKLNTTKPTVEGGQLTNDKKDAKQQVRKRKKLIVLSMNSRL